MKSTSGLLAVLSLLVISSLVQSSLGAKAKKNGEKRVARQDDDDDVDLSAELELDEDGRNLKEMIEKEEAAASASGQEGGVNLRFKQVIPWKIQHIINKKRKYFTVSTAFTVTTTTVHVTSPTAALCAKLVNVTGACRLRRGLWVEEPVILSFDDDMDAIDGPLSPTAALRIEPTALPNEKRDAAASSSPSTDVIQPSTSSTASDEEQLDDDDAEEEPELGRLGFRNFLALKHALKKRLKMKHIVTIITTTVLTSTTTSTDYTTVTTKTFFIQLCTPSPFPFHVCPARKK